MLLSLRLRHFVIVDELELHFQPGFTVLTGETGAGKSILIDALGLLLGARAEAGLVRQGCDKADLTAEFALPPDLPELHDWLQTQELLGDEGVCLLRRTVDAQGRSRAFINGQVATVAQLRTVGEFLLDIHGQHAHQSLMRAEVQRNVLDAYAGATGLVQQVRAAYLQWRQVVDALERARKDADVLGRERENLSWQVEELAALGMAPDEWESLQAEHQRLSHASSLIEGGQQVLAALAADDSGVHETLLGVQARLRPLAPIDPALAEVLALLDTAEAHVSEAVHHLRRHAERVELDPERLAVVERRMDDLYRMARKHRVEPARLPECLLGWQRRLDEIAQDADVEGLDAARQSAEVAYYQLASALKARRQVAAVCLGEKVSEQMQAMAMQGSRLAVALLPLEGPAGHGLEAVEFQVAPHAAAPARSLAKVASGGELSRISLALQVVTSQITQVPTLIFDEVDVGIGGGVAQIVGQLLRRLGERHQVLCVTHLPQVAACGNQQLQVSKRQGEEGVISHIQCLTETGRIEEIARMLGGVEITATTRQHAAELLGVNPACVTVS